MKVFRYAVGLMLLIAGHIFSAIAMNNGDGAPAHGRALQTTDGPLGWLTYLLVPKLFTVGIPLWLLVQVFGAKTCKVLGISKTCICDEQSLRDFIQSDDKPVAGGLRAGIICPTATIELPEEIDITGKELGLFCGGTNFDPVGPLLPILSPSVEWCRIIGAKAKDGENINHRLFRGAPRFVWFFGFTFSDGNADNGGLFSLTGGDTLFSFCTFSNGKATSNGGAILASNDSYVELRNSVFTDNSAQNGGGIAAIEGASISVDGSPVFRGNSASEKGGAIYVASAGEAIIEGGNLLGNMAADGGAISVMNANVSISGKAVFAGSNMATGEGDNIFIADDDEPSLGGSFVDCETRSSEVPIFCGEFGISDSGIVNNTDCTIEGNIGSTTSPDCML